jgi:hypothetical protein
MRSPISGVPCRSSHRASDVELLDDSEPNVRVAVLMHARWRRCGRRSGTAGSGSSAAIAAIIRYCATHSVYVFSAARLLPSEPNLRLGCTRPFLDHSIVGGHADQNRLGRLQAEHRSFGL